jgi:AcrR family transcriptional regulator
MGTRERQEREREIVRRAIIDAARDLFIAEGFGKVSMRKIAERIEYSPAAIYSYFPGKDDIFYALAEEGFQLLCDGIGPIEEMDQVEPVELIRRAMRGLYRFSQAHPEYYALMFLDRSVPHLKGAQHRMPRFAAMMERLCKAMQQCIDEGMFPSAPNPTTVFKLLMTATHGAASQNVCGRLLPGQDGAALVNDLIELTLAGLRAGVPLTFIAMPWGGEREAAGADPVANGPEPVES